MASRKVEDKSEEEHGQMDQFCEFEANQKMKSQSIHWILFHKGMMKNWRAPHHARLEGVGNGRVGLC